MLSLDTYQRIDIFLKLFATAFVVFSIWKFYAERAQNLESEAQRRSIEYIERYSPTSGDLDYQVLLKFWSEQRVILDATANKELSDREYQGFVEVSLDAEGGAKVARAVLGFLSFFDEIYFCRSERICDVGVIDRYFCTDVVAFHRTYAAFQSSISRRLKVTNVGRSLSSFSSECVQKI